MESHQNTIISVKDIRKSFGKVEALRGITLEVEKGTVLGLLGPNGAGKTTLVRVLTTLLQPDSGSATIAGVSVTDNPAAVRNYIGLAGQYAAVDENLTGRENLQLIGKLYHLTKNEIEQRTNELLQQFSLVDAAGRTAKTYSGGMRRRLDLAASLIGHPDILFLDEPTTGLDPRSRAELWEVIQDLVKQGTTLLLTTQYLEEADYLADRIIMIDKGMVIAEGTADELKAKIGGGVLGLHLADKTKTAQVLELLKQLNEGEPHIDEVTDAISVATQHGSQTLLDAIRLLDTAGVAIADIELRKPTLDEVFLSLTETRDK